MDLLSEEVRRDPYPVYDRLRAVAPVLTFGPAWVLLDHASVSRALREPDVFGSEVVPPAVDAPEGPVVRNLMMMWQRVVQN